MFQIQLYYFMAYDSFLRRQLRSINLLSIWTSCWRKAFATARPSPGLGQYALVFPFHHLHFDESLERKTIASWSSRTSFGEKCILLKAIRLFHLLILGPWNSWLIGFDWSQVVAKEKLNEQMKARFLRISNCSKEWDFKTLKSIFKLPNPINSVNSSSGTGSSAVGSGYSLTKSKGVYIFLPWL